MRAFIGIRTFVSHERKINKIQKLLNVFFAKMGEKQYRLLRNDYVIMSNLEVSTSIKQAFMDQTRLVQVQAVRPEKIEKSRTGPGQESFKNL